MRFINWQCIFYLLSMLQLKHHKAMWCNGRKFRIKMLDDKMKTSDCGITAVFKVTNISSRSDRNLEETENRYYGHLEDIIECDFNSFKIVLFEVKWYRLRMHERDPERTVIEHDNGFTMVNTRAFEPGTEPYVLPSQCEQVFYSEVPGKAGWSYVVRYDPRGRPVKYNHVAEDEDNNEEEDHDYADQEQVAHVVDVSDEEVEEVDHPNVGDDDVIDDIDNYISENDVDDDVDMNEPLTNIDSEPDPDTDVELDEEEDD
jgi:hypothetical protein